jgi:hypothetical protein
MVKTIQQMKRVILNYPEKPKKTYAACCDANGDPDPDMFEMAVFAWKEDYKSMKSKMDRCKSNKSNVWALIYNQCSAELKNKLEGMQGCNTAKSENNMVKFWTMIHGYCCQFDLLSNKYMAIVAAIKNLSYFFQKTEQSNADYHKDFVAMLKVIKEYGGAGSMTHFPNMLKRELETNGTDLSKATSEQLKDKRQEEDRLQEVSCCPHAKRSQWSKYNDLKWGIKENFVMGTSKYPENPEAVFWIFNAYTSRLLDGTSAGRMLGQWAKNEQYLHRPKVETALGSWGRTVSNVGSRGTSHESVLKNKGRKSRCTQMLRQTQEQKKRTLTEGRTEQNRTT